MLESVSVQCNKNTTYNKSSAVAEMGDRLATIDKARKMVAAVLLSVGWNWVPI